MKTEDSDVMKTMTLWMLMACMTVSLASRVAAIEPRNVRLQNMFVVNEDCSHFFTSRTAAEMNVKGLHDWVDKYAGGAVTHLFLNPNGMRASFRSQTREAIWDINPATGKEPQHKWPQNAKRLHKAGIDPYKVWIARCRAKKISPWLSMRMNDIHQTEKRNNFQHSSFWRKNVPLWRMPNHEHGSGLNYAHKKVREYQLSFIRELLERYDPDGLELDWMRTPTHLTPGKEFQERVLLTRFMASVRALVNQWSKKRGHPILLGVRAPAHPDAGPGTGMDAVEWARQGYVDLIVATPFYFSTDFDIPFELWRARLKNVPEPVSVIGGVESTSRPWIFGTPVGNTMETLRGFMASARYRGTQGLYLFNWMDANNWPVPAQDYKTLLRDGVGTKFLAAGARRHIVCFHDTVPKGFPSGTQLPADARSGKKLRLHIGPKPKSGKAWAVVGLAKRNGVASARFQARLNGRALKRVGDLPSTRELGGKAVRGVRFECPIGAFKNGYNRLEVRQQAGGKDQQIVWVEVKIRMKDEG